MSSTKTTANPSADRRQCICGNPKCKQRRQQILELGNADHVWASNNGFTVIRAPSPNTRKMKVKLIHEALRHCCDYHFKVTENKRRLTGIYTVASIHFPVELLEAKSNRTQMLTVDEAVFFDKTAGYTGNNLKEKVNQIGKLLEERFENGKLDDGSIIPKELKTQLSNLYVQAPVHPGSFVDSFIEEKVNILALQRSKRRVTLASAAKADKCDDEMDTDISSEKNESRSPVASFPGSPEVRIDLEPPSGTTPPFKAAKKPKTTPDVYSVSNACLYLSERYSTFDQNQEQFYADDCTSPKS